MTMIRVMVMALMMLMMMMMLVVMVQSASATKWDKCGSTVNPMDKHKKCTIRAKHKCRSLNGDYPPAIKRGNVEITNPLWAMDALLGKSSTNRGCSIAMITGG